MKVGSQIVCIDDYFYTAVGDALPKWPKRGDEFICADIRPCSCGYCARTMVELAGMEGYGFDIDNFREIQPPLDITTLIEECKTETV